MFHFKPFQLADLARLAIPDGAIYAGEPGTGKTPMGIAWALLKVGLKTPQIETLCPLRPPVQSSLLPSAPVLIVCPGGLMQQMQADYANLFSRAWPGVTRINSQTTLASLCARNRGRLAPGWYMSSYQEIALNKFQLLPSVPDGPAHDGIIRACMDFFELPYASASWERPCPTPGPPLSMVEGLARCRQIARDTAIGLDTERNGIRCIYRPALADLMRDQFAAVIIDEGVHVKGAESIIGLGVRRLNPRYRLVLTGTPIKNRLPDICFLAAWACDALDKPNDRWPYAINDEPGKFGVPPSGGKESGTFGVPPLGGREFAKDFLVFSSESGERGRPGRRALRPAGRSGSPTTDISNIQKLWTVLSPVVLRRRKCDIPEQEIVPKIHHTITVPMGAEQARVYQYHLTAPYRDARGQPAAVARMMALRAAAAAPCSESLGKVRSAKPFIPKVRACLEIVRGVLERQEQVVIFSPFHDPLDVLSGYLAEAGIPHDVMDGRISPQKRARLAMNFKLGLSVGRDSVEPLPANPVLLAGLKACAEGYSWHLCNNVILYTFDWALDLMLQAVDRVHRINSVKPVNVWSLVVAGTIERNLQAMLEDKRAAADLALDGLGPVPSGAPPDGEEISMASLLTAQPEPADKSEYESEATCLAAWPRLRQELATAWSAQQQNKIAA